jgi:hypothetical protein
MSLRAALVDLIGAEIQQHEITLGSKRKQMHFRQFSDAEGQEIFRVVDGESDDERGRRIMREVVRLSACDEAGRLLSTVEEVRDLPGVVLQVLFQAAAKTNNLQVTPATAPDDTAEAAPPNG